MDAITIARALRALEHREPWSATSAARHGAGADRIRAWVEAGQPTADRTALCVIGDRSIVGVVRDVVDLLPEAAAHFIVRNVAVFCTGVESRGRCHMPIAFPCSNPTIVLIARADDGIVAHELAHAWHRQGLPSDLLLTAGQTESLNRTFSEIAIETQSVDAFVDDQLEYERAADELARLWGFQIDSTSADRGERRRRNLIAHVEHQGSAAR